MPPRKHRFALVYDFDGTLSPKNMHEYDFIPKLNTSSDAFWKEVKALAKKQGADEILAYMRVMLKKAAAQEIQVRKKNFKDYGKSVELFPGVTEWFDIINKFGEEHGVHIEHYIVSSGIKEMINGTAIAKYFQRVFASSFMYDEHDVACWPATAVNYTTKTQYLFRINKKAFDESNSVGVNAFTPEEDRPIPFSQMMYIGDGDTDVPCMKLVKDKGGLSIAVYENNGAGSAKRGKKKKAQKLMEEGRISYFAPADYTQRKELYEIVTKAILLGKAKKEMHLLKAKT